MAALNGGATSPRKGKGGLGSRGWFKSLRSDGVDAAPASDAGSGKQLPDSWGADDAQQSLWSPAVATAMGYGKGGRSGSAFQWWILVCSALVAIGSYVAWCVLVFRARDSTQAAIDAAGLTLGWWDNLKAILIATAVAYPVLALAAVAVSLWRAWLARQLNIHAPNSAWMASCKRFQAATLTSSGLLYGLFILLMVSIGAHAVWAYSARSAHYASYYAIRYVDPVWTGVSSVVNATEGLVDNFVGLTQSLPAIGGRRLAEADPSARGGARLLRELTPEDVAAMPPHVVEAGVAAARSLQQLKELPDVLGGLLNGAAGAISQVGSSVPAAARGALDTAALPSLPFLPQILPNGSDNPLFQTLSGVTKAVQQQVLNATGCPMYCVDLRDQRWIRDGCICNLDRVKAAYPHLGPIFASAIPATGMVFAMTVAATWLLLHAASQWARTRSEAKLLRRLPNAAQLAATTAVVGGAAPMQPAKSADYEQGLPAV